MRLTRELLFTLYDFSLGIAPEDDPPASAWPGPSADDIESIEAALGVRLPNLLIALAHRPTFPGDWFADLTAPSRRHILDVNEYFRKDGGSSLFSTWASMATAIASCAGTPGRIRIRPRSFT